MEAQYFADEVARRAEGLKSKFTSAVNGSQEKKSKLDGKLSS